MIHLRDLCKELKNLPACCVCVCVCAWPCKGWYCCCPRKHTRLEQAGLFPEVMEWAGPRVCVTGDLGGRPLEHGAAPAEAPRLNVPGTLWGLSVSSPSFFLAE